MLEITDSTIVGLMVISPCVQVLSAIAAVMRRRAYLKRFKSLRSFYLAGVISTVSMLTYLIFIQVLYSMWTIAPAASYLVVIWSVLTVLNRLVLPLTIAVALLPPYPPRTWMSPLFRLSAIGTAIGAGYMTQQILPMSW
jgi:hypothetical protein